jgi:hypothetical protein
MTARRGMVDAPFQLLINVIVFGMVITIGFYLYSNATCWRCNELLKGQGINLREAIASVGRGDLNSRENILVKIDDLGGCAKAIYLRHLKADDGFHCESFCPQHPNSCWVVVTESTCGGAGLDMECIDISGDTEISAEEGVLGMLTTAEEQVLQGAYFISHNQLLSIEKTGPSALYIGKQ